MNANDAVLMIRSLAISVLPTTITTTPTDYDFRSHDTAELAANSALSVSHRSRQSERKGLSQLSRSVMTLVSGQRMRHMPLMTLTLSPLPRYHSRVGRGRQICPGPSLATGKAAQVLSGFPQSIWKTVMDLQPMRTQVSPLAGLLEHLTLGHGLTMVALLHLSAENIQKTGSWFK